MNYNPENMKYKPIVLIVGASGSGKSSLVEELEKNYGFKAIPSYTTRKPRTPNEKGHTFVTDEEFDRLENVIAYAETTGARYCVTEEQFDNEEYNLYVIDNSGLEYLKRFYEGQRDFVVAYITAPLIDRYKRMVRRPIDNPVEAALKRIEHDAVEFKNVVYDIRIENANGYFNEAFAALYLFCKHEGVIE